LRALRTHEAEQLAKSRFCLVKLPDLMFLHGLDYFD
jgi:hypothetical protein